MTKKEIVIVVSVLMIAHIAYSEYHDCKMAGGNFSLNSIWFVCEK